MNFILLNCSGGVMENICGTLVGMDKGQENIAWFGVHKLMKNITEYIYFLHCRRKY